jgi:hypothetical protein
MLKARKILISLSLANLVLLQEQHLTLSLSVHGADSSNFTPSARWAYFTLLLVIAAVLFFVSRKAEKTGRTRWTGVQHALLIIVSSLFFLHLMTMVRFLERFPKLADFQYTNIYSFLTHPLFVYPLLLLIAWATLGYRKRLLRAVRTVAILLAPLMIFMVAIDAWATIYESFVDQKKPLPDKSAPSNRVVWILFDEMDPLFLFSQRPPSLDLPEFDRFRSQALVAENAFSPSPSTVISIPSSIMGRALSKNSERSPWRLLAVDRRTEEPIDCKKEPSLFSKAHDLKIKSGVAGWAVPYCTVWGEFINSCHRIYSFQREYSHSYFSNLKEMTQRVFRIIETPEAIHALVQSQVLTRGLDLIKDPNLQLVFLHFAVPHNPGVSEELGRKNTYRNPASSEAEAYFNNLAIADGALGKIRAQMEADGQWESSTVLITADHWWRRAELEMKSKEDAQALKKRPGPKGEVRVPFLVKFPKQNKISVYKKPFDVSIIRDFILAALGSSITTEDQGRGWLDQNVTRYSPLPPPAAGK